MAAFRPCLLILWLHIQTSFTQSPSFFEWQYPLWSKHNELRSQVATGSVSGQPFATNMEQLFYESNMEQVPLKHALQCNYTHNTDLSDDMKSIKDELSFKMSEVEPFGENIAYFQSSNEPFLSPTQLQDIIEEQWFIPNIYDYLTGQCIANPTDSDCVAYQRLLWARTRYMACGVSLCPSLHFPDDDRIDTISNAVFIVCNYWPSYDKDELPIYQTSTVPDDDDIMDHVCTECAADRSNECTDGLCAGCAAPNYNYCQDRIPEVCEGASSTACDPIMQLYCAFTCFCSEDDWIPQIECSDLYLDAPIHDECQRLGWYDVPQIEKNASVIECADGYSLASMENIDFVEDNCLLSEDAEKLDDVIRIAGKRYKPNGIAIGMIRYDIGCDWNEQYSFGVIPTQNGIQCGDRKQLFVCVQDGNTSAPTSAPTEGPTFSPTIEPTAFDTTLDVEVPATTEEYEPFRMYLVFPDNKHMDSRRLSSDNHGDPIPLYPAHGVHVSLPIENEIGFGYEFSLASKGKHESEIGLSQIMYAIETNKCEVVNEEWIQFKLFEQGIGIESIVYNVRRTDDADKGWMNIVIDVEDYRLKFDVLYRFMIDVSLLRDNCESLSHPIYGKTVGNFDIEKNHFIVKGLKSITCCDLNHSNEPNLYKFWMNMSIKFA
eukprot:251283_1